MGKIRWGLGLLVGGLLLSGAVASAQSVTPEAVMASCRPNPRHNIDITTPSKAELGACEVKKIGATGSSGWLLVDASGKPVRRIFNYTASGQQVTVYSYYKDGLEVYREMDTNGNKKIDEYRWFNSGGMKWGVDTNEDGVIDSWKMISEEEAAQEAFQAVVTKDYARLQALFISDGELQQLGLPAAYQQKIKTKMAQASKKFQETSGKVTVASDKTVGRVESIPPSCVPGESIGTSHDLFRYPSLAILYESAPGKHDWLQTGEMVKVGMAWRLIDVPFTGDGGPPIVPPNPVTNPVMEEIAKLDQKYAVPVSGTTGPNATAVAYYLERVALIDKLLPKLTKQADLESWYKQKGDNLQSACLASKDGDTQAMKQLKMFRDQVVQQSPKNPLAGYLTYRCLWSEYARKLPGGDAKVQAEWTEKLIGFVKDYPTAEDTPDALIYLGNGYEFAGTKDDLAKGYYEQLVKNFPQHPLAAKASGAIRRLDLVGHRMELAADTLSGQRFEIANLTKNKSVVVVYYWASYSATFATDFGKLKKLYDEYHTKGLEVVTVNVDLKNSDASNALQNAPNVPFAHLFAAAPANAMESPLAIQYGIMGLPAIILVGRDGNVISRTVQINDLDDAIRKANN